MPFAATLFWLRPEKWRDPIREAVLVADEDLANEKKVLFLVSCQSDGQRRRGEPRRSHRQHGCGHISFHRKAIAKGWRLDQQVRTELEVLVQFGMRSNLETRDSRPPDPSVQKRDVASFPVLITFVNQNPGRSSNKANVGKSPDRSFA